MKKKINIGLLFLVMCNAVYASHSQVEVRQKPYKYPIYVVRGGQIVSMGVSLLGLLVKMQEDAGSVSKQEPVGTFTMSVGLLGVALCQAIVSRFKKRNEILWQNPVLVFDEQGFTYTHQSGPHKGATIKYYWKDVISHWGVADEDGSSIFWNYHVRGHKDIVSIEVYNLHIPEGMRAQIESLRQGYIAALDCSY